MRTARSSSRPGGYPPGTPGAGTPRSRHPPGPDQPPGTRPPLEQAPTPGAGTPPASLWTEFLTHAYENITLTQISFAGGNNQKWVQCGVY